MKKALITGVFGQDGIYLSKFLLDLVYQVVGIINKPKEKYLNKPYCEELLQNQNFKVKNSTLLIEDDVFNLINNIGPDEIYNLAGQSDVSKSYNLMSKTYMTNTIVPINIISSVLKIEKKIKFLQASSCEIYGNVVGKINEKFEYKPQSPYAHSKLIIDKQLQDLRRQKNIFASSAILFNHESPLRNLNFVTRKITNFVANYYFDKSIKLEIGNLNSKRDWGYAGDFVEAYHKILQLKNADDFIIATGQEYSVRDFIKNAFLVIDVDIKFDGDGLNEVGYISDIKDPIIVINSDYYRDNDIDARSGDYTKAKEILNWQPETSIEKLVEMMVNYDLSLMENKN